MAIVKTVNAEGGSDARYDVSQMTPAERANFDSEGRPLGVGFPDQNVWTPGLPGARGGTGPGFDAGSGGGGTPMDAYTRQLQSLLESQSQTQKADTIAQIRQALISYGVVPQGFKDTLGVLDPTTLSLIQKNTDTGISGYARMLQEKQDAQNQMLAKLSAAGLRRSGSKGYLQRRAQLNWDRQSADATAALLSDIGGKQRSFADAEAQRKMQLLSALFNQQYSPSAQYKQFQASQPVAPPTYQPAQAPAPGFQNQGYLTGQKQDNGYQIPTGGGWYTNQQTGGLTSKWQQLARMG